MKDSAGADTGLMSVEMINQEIEHKNQVISLVTTMKLFMMKVLKRKSEGDVDCTDVGENLSWVVKTWQYDPRKPGLGGGKHGAALAYFVGRGFLLDMPEISKIVSFDRTILDTIVSWNIFPKKKSDKADFIIKTHFSLPKSGSEIATGDVDYYKVTFHFCISLSDIESLEKQFMREKNKLQAINRGRNES